MEGLEAEIRRLSSLVETLCQQRSSLSSSTPANQLIQGNIQPAPEFTPNTPTPANPSMLLRGSLILPIPNLSPLYKLPSPTDAGFGFPSLPSDDVQDAFMNAMVHFTMDPQGSGLSPTQYSSGEAVSVLPKDPPTPLPSTIPPIDPPPSDMDVDIATNPPTELGGETQTLSSNAVDITQNPLPEIHGEIQSEAAAPPTPLSSEDIPDIPSVEDIDIPPKLLNLPPMSNVSAVGSTSDSLEMVRANQVFGGVLNEGED
jgi:hypothetical protein